MASLTDALYIILPYYGYKPTPGLLNALFKYVFSPEMLKTYPSPEAALKEIFGSELPPGLSRDITDLVRIENETEDAAYREQALERYLIEHQAYGDLSKITVRGLPQFLNSPKAGPQQQNLELLVASHLNAAKYDFSQNQAQFEKLVHQIALLKVNNPQADFSELLRQNILPQLEQFQSKPDVQQILAGLSFTLTSFDLKAKGADLSLQTLEAELSRVLSPAEAKSAALALRAGRADYLAHEAASYTPVTSLSPTIMRANRAEAFGDFLQTQFETYLPPSQQVALDQGYQQIDLSRLYAAYSADSQSQPLQITTNLPSLPQPVQNLVNQGFSQLQSKVSKAAAEKIGKKLGVEVSKAAAKTVVKEGAKVAAKAGAEVAAQGANVIPGLGVIVAAGIEVLDRVVSTLKKYGKEIAEGLAATLVFGLYGIGAAIGTVVGAVGALATGIAAAITTALLAVLIPLLVILLAVPIILVFILYIINTSAYLVPPSSLTLVTGPGGFVNRSSCPLANGSIANKSYDPSLENSPGAHGTNYYWENVMGKTCVATNSCVRCDTSSCPANAACTFNLPQTSGVTNRAPLNGPGNVCYNLYECDQTSSSGCTLVYGFAADIFGGSANTPAYLPLINGLEETWSYVPGSFFENGIGGANGYSYAFETTNGLYTLLFTHINLISNPDSIVNFKSGQQVAALFDQGGNTHLHIEFQVNGVYQKPENFFCGGSAPGFIVVNCTEPGPYPASYSVPTPTGYPPLPAISDFTNTYKPSNQSTPKTVPVATTILSSVQQLIAWGTSNGFKIYVDEGYRTYDQQLALCTACQALGSGCSAERAEWSQHRVGRAIDIYDVSTGVIESLPQLTLLNQFPWLIHPVSTDPPHYCVSLTTGDCNP